ncbi:MAG: hypothetical protein RLZZ400_451 [Actinomycetota bacterium]|jgi:two-component system sensor histidine kinase SenX3
MPYEWLIFAAGLLVGGLVMGIVASRVRSNVIEKFEQSQSISDAAAELLEVLSTAALVMDSDNYAVRATQGALSFGLIRDRSLIHDELEDLVNRARESGQVEISEVELEVGLRKKSTFFTARAFNIGESNVLLILEDRTESKRLDDTRRDFIANISHELKTPIGAISLLSEAIDGAKDDPAAVSKFNAQLSRESKRLAQLVQDVIQLSRFQSTEVFSKAENVEVNAVVLDAIDRNQFLAQRRNIKLNHESTDSLQVYGDAEMLTVALKNLIENAILYSDEGSTVGVGVKLEGDVVSISVTDQGVGLSPDDQKRIFERFYRVDQSRSRETGGTGLGLSIVKHVALSHQGEVRVFSKPGVGSTFTLRLPVAVRNIEGSDIGRTAE